jgi:acyl carrier protein
MSIQDSAILQSPFVADDLVTANEAVGSVSQSVLSQPRSAAETQDWIVAYLAKLLEVDPIDVDVTIPFDRYGLDSAAAFGLTGELEDWLGREIDPTLLYDYPTIESLVQHLSEGN